VDTSKWLAQLEFDESSKTGQIQKEFEQEGISDDCLAYFFTGDDGYRPIIPQFWLSKENVMLTFNTSAAPLMVCNGDYPVSFKTFRHVIRPEFLPLYDRYAADARKGAKIPPD
jgi:hypothetical protein